LYWITCLGWWKVFWETSWIYSWQMDKPSRKPNISFLYTFFCWTQKLHWITPGLNWNENNACKNYFFFSVLEKSFSWTQKSLFTHLITQRWKITKNHQNLGKMKNYFFYKKETKFLKNILHININLWYFYIFLMIFYISFILFLNYIKKIKVWNYNIYSNYIKEIYINYNLI
jgi:hypothetical protein